MLYDLIYISSFVVAILGLIIIVAMISNRMYLKVMKEVNALVDNMPPLEMFTFRSTTYSFFKRIFDLIFASIAMFILCPILLIISTAIILDSKGPVFYKMQRIGRNGKVFYSYKFRTLKSVKKITYKNAIRSDSDPRITRLGLFLRKTSLDELPELFNVLKGNMSIVGTTMAREYDYDGISDEQRKILYNVKPGLTSLWVYSTSRSDYKYDNRLLFDLYYVHNYSFKLDMAIIYRTIVFTLGETASF